MTAISNNPTNINFLAPQGLRFLVRRMPNVNFFVQRANIPGINLPAVEAPNPFVQVPHGGDHITYNELVVTFKVDEDLKNYLEIHDWIRGLGFPEEHQEYADLLASAEGLNSDVVLMILTSAKNPNLEVTFKDALPVNLSDLIFDTTDDQVTNITASAAFRYISFDIARVV